MAPYVAMSDTQDNGWDVGMTLPPGVSVSLDLQQQQRTMEYVGSGQLACPRAIWVYKAPYEMARKAAIEDIVQTIAVKVGATHAWIRSDVHTTGYSYDEFGNRLRLYNRHGEFIGYELVEKDPHITVNYGTSDTVVVVHGHVYVKTNRKGMLTGFMERGTREHVYNRDDRILELWKMTRDSNRPGPLGAARYCPQHPTETARCDEHYCGRTHWKTEYWTRDTWATELVAMVTSIACLVAICVMFKTFNAGNNRVPDFPGAVNLDAIILTLSTVSSSLTMYAVPAAINQVKWD
ncbi:hypothetical protein PG997_006369 [Apiospora hydei]|uniref:Uncharacterized protein n=1 Tax=Apiospora hydei TaxID=1337664 RepID=A0ABR1WRV0_9PEZI